MKKIFTLTLFLVALSVSAQRLKYRDLFVLLPGLSSEQQKTQLKEYLVEDLDHPNANFRLALIYENNYKNSDALTDYAYVMANAEQAKIRFFKSKQIVTEREVDRNNEYYAPIFKMFDAKGKPFVPYPIVSAKINNGLDSATLFLAKAPDIYKNFTKSVNHYDQATKIFAKISEEFSSPENLYLLYDDQVDKRFTQLKMNYDSSIFFLENYLKLIKEYPIQGHKQTYKVKAINTYRLDGLITRMNFLTNSIDLWDYGTWVDNVRKKVKTDVEDLRLKITKTNEKLDETLQKISVSTATNLPAPSKIDKQLVFNLNNLDRQSVVLSILEYKHFRQEWDILHRGKQLDTSLSVRNAEVFTNLIYANRKADTLLRELKLKITAPKVDKHRQFVVKNFGGQPGLEKYATNEQQYIATAFNEYGNELRTNLLGSAVADPVFTNKENSIKTTRGAVSLLLQTPTPELLEQGLFVTLFNKKNPDGSAYIAGIYKEKKKSIVNSYLLRLNPDGKTAWIKDLSVSVDSAVVGDANTYLGPVVLTQEGCALVTRSVHTSRGDQINTFFYINEKGEERLRKKILENSFPRTMVYSEKSNAFILSLKGNTQEQNFSSIEAITTLSINVLGEVIWKKDIQLTGTLVDLIPVIDGYLLAGNFLIMKDPKGAEVRTKVSSKECSPYVVKLSERGELITSQPFLTPGSFYLKRIVKVSDNSVNLLGYHETVDIGLSKVFSPGEKMLHIMTNRTGQLICSDY
jgi:hypothetical protein